MVRGASRSSFHLLESWGQLPHVPQPLPSPGGCTDALIALTPKIWENHLNSPIPRDGPSFSSSVTRACWSHLLPSELDGAVRPVVLFQVFELTLPLPRKAKMMLDDIVSRGRGGPPGQFHDNANGGQNGTVQEIMIPAGKAGLVIGKGGETIKQLQVRGGMEDRSSSCPRKVSFVHLCV